MWINFVQAVVFCLSLTFPSPHYFWGRKTEKFCRWKAFTQLTNATVSTSIVSASLIPHETEWSIWSDRFEIPGCFHQDNAILLLQTESGSAQQINLNPSDSDQPELDLRAKSHRHLPLFLPLFVLLCCDSTLPPVSAGRWQQAEASAGGGVFFPRTELRQVSSAAPLTSSWIQQRPHLDDSDSDE